MSGQHTEGAMDIYHHYIYSSIDLGDREVARVETPGEWEKSVLSRIVHTWNCHDELVEALQAVESYLVERGIETRGITGRTIVLPKIKAALAKAANREVGNG